MAAEAAFGGIRGQGEAVSLLRRALATGRVAHAYAFVGPSGAGRKPTALAFAKALVAPGGGAAAARVDRGAHPDVLLFLSGGPGRAGDHAADPAREGDDGRADPCHRRLSGREGRGAHGSSTLGVGGPVIATLK